MIAFSSKVHKANNIERERKKKVNRNDDDEEEVVAVWYKGLCHCIRSLEK